MKKWIFNSKLDNFDVLGAFAGPGFIDWGTNREVDEGDIVYLYMGAPVKKLLMRTRVIINDVKEPADDTEYQEENYNKIGTKKKLVRLVAEECFLGEKMKYLTFEKLMDNGLNGVIRSQLSLDNNPQLKEYIELVEA